MDFLCFQRANRSVSKPKSFELLPQDCNISVYFDWLKLSRSFGDLSLMYDSRLHGILAVDVGFCSNILFVLSLLKRSVEG